MSIASLFKGHFSDGGPFFMTLHFIMWILVIFYVVKFIKNYKQQEKNLKLLEKFNSTILFIGVFGFLFAWFYRMVNMYGAFSAIAQAGDISPTLVANGMRMSFIAPMYAFFLFLITFLIWFTFRNKIKAI